MYDLQLLHSVFTYILGKIDFFLLFLSVYSGFLDTVQLRIIIFVNARCSYRILQYIVTSNLLAIKILLLCHNNVITTI